MKNLKRFLLLSVFFFLLSALSFSDVTLTDEEFDQVMMELNKSKAELEISKSKNLELNQELNALKNEVRILENTINGLQTGYNLQLTFLNELKKDQWIKNLEWFLIGAAAGFAGGNYTGIQIGIKLSL